jgi:hypothetical protein
LELKLVKADVLKADRGSVSRICVFLPHPSVSFSLGAQFIAVRAGFGVKTILEITLSTVFFDKKARLYSGGKKYFLDGLFVVEVDSGCEVFV